MNLTKMCYTYWTGQQQIRWKWQFQVSIDNHNNHIIAINNNTVRYNLSTKNVLLERNKMNGGKGHEIQ